MPSLTLTQYWRNRYKMIDFTLFRDTDKFHKEIKQSQDQALSGRISK